MRITVLGAGAWGTALARLFHQAKHRVTLWGHDADHLETVRRTGRNDRYLPGIELPHDWQLETSVPAALRDAECVTIAVPSSAFRNMARQVKGFPGVAISVTKGIEHDTGLTMCRVLQQESPGTRVAALSGPTLALEVARGIPTAAVAASEDLATAALVQRLVHCATLRVYTSGDLLGVELGGALKNVIAIAAGVCDGLGFGDNSKAALITRGIAEMRRIGLASGAQPDTFAGLSGLGDLTVTCFSRLSRNRGFGERLGRGENPETILASLVAVAEGYPTSLSAYQLARRLGLPTPLIDEVHAMLYAGKNPKEAVRDLMSRDTKAED